MFESKNPFHFTVVLHMLSDFYIILAKSILTDNIQHESYCFAHLTYIMLLHYLGNLYL